jgi:ssDNA-binding Zn-finger/Zn-ribbon topoisomerase 1
MIKCLKEIKDLNRGLPWIGQELSEKSEKMEAVGSECSSKESGWKRVW